MKIKILCLMCFVTLAFACKSQNLNARVVINYDLMPPNIERRIFVNLQNDLMSFLNTTKWNDNIYDFNEKIECNFILNLEAYLGENTFAGSLNVVASRPVFNSIYLSTTINLTDREIAFQYNEGQALIFNEFRVQSPAPLVDNLTAVFAYYAYMIVGLDNNSFKNRGGVEAFQKAMNVANNAPENKIISGWNPSQSRRNRYWLADAVFNITYQAIHNVYYLYYRGGLDNLATDPVNAHKNIYNALLTLANLYAENGQNLALLPLFIQGKTNELIRIYQNEPIEKKQEFIKLMQQIDVGNYLRMKRELNL